MASDSTKLQNRRCCFCPVLSLKRPHPPVVQNNNSFDVDQNAFTDALNVYVNDQNTLVSREPLVNDSIEIAYPSETPTHKELYSLCETLAQKGPSKIVVTGLQRNGYIENFIFQTGKPYEIVKVKKVGVDRSGTGDVFTSIVAASVVKNEDFAESVQKAADFISKALAFTTKMNLPTNYGVCFEEFLTELK